MYLINVLEKVHIEAMRIISGETKLTPLRELYKDTYFSYEDERVIFVSVLDRNYNI
jgi:hypothetical protein